jgi:hypothetical protein
MECSASQSSIASRQILGPIMFPVLCFLVAVASIWMPSTRFGGFGVLLLLTLVLILITIMAIPLSMALLFLGRGAATQYLAASICALITVVLGIRIEIQLRMAAFQKLADRSKQLVAAIQDYEAQRGELPQRLDDLVPDFLPSVPSTGMGSYPNYNYFVEAEASEYGNNRSVLEVFTPKPGINFDRFLYYPDQDYPKTGFGGQLERIGAWAYVHE